MKFLKFHLRTLKISLKSHPSYWLPLINLETVEAVNLRLCNIRDNRAKLGFPFLLHSPYFGQHFHNFRFNNSIDIKLGTLSRTEKRNIIASKSEDDVMPKSYGAIAIL